MEKITRAAKWIADWLDSRRLAREGKRRAVTIVVEVDQSVVRIPGVNLNDILMGKSPAGASYHVYLHKGIIIEPQRIEVMNTVWGGGSGGGGGCQSPSQFPSHEE